MGKLSIEEKAKAYDKALERAQALYNDKNEIGYANAESVLEEVFPLLKESKDERIRKEIINYFAKGKEYLSLCSIGKDDILAWLEKQAEQKPTLRERYKNIAESEWFKKTHNGMSVSNDEGMIEALRTEYEKGRADVIADTLSWLANVWPQYCSNPNIIDAYKEGVVKE